MPYGTNAFTDGYGDYKQPTIINYDKEADIIPYSSTEEERKQISSQYEKDQEDALIEILSINPIFGGEKYQHIIIIEDNKLKWDEDKINLLKSNVDWLFDLMRYVRKRKNLLITT